MLDGWQDDPDVQAWLIPVNPSRHGPSMPAGIKFLRTLATEGLYWPLLFRELQRADVVHVFSASYTSFLLAAARDSRRENTGPAVVLNYHSGEAPDHLRRSALARRVLKSWSM